MKQFLFGDSFIEVKDSKNGGKIATLYSGKSFGVLEVENMSGKIRIKDLEVGSAYVKPEHLKLMLKETGIMDILVNEVK